MDAVKEAVKSERERPRRREVVALETRGWKERERRRKGGEKRRKREKDVVRLDFSTFDGEETEKPGRLHGAAEKVANSKTFRGPIISDETTVRHQGGCPVYLDL